MSQQAPESADPTVRAFLSTHFPGSGAGGVPEVVRLVGDASRRRYFRCRDGRGSTAILTLYPSAVEPARFSYRQIYDLLRRIEIPVPEILALDAEHGLLLQEDLGSVTLEASAAGSQERLFEHLRTAIHYIVTMQVEGTPAFEPGQANFTLHLDESLLGWELDFFLHHYAGDFRKLRIDKLDRLQREFQAIAGELGRSPRLFCHRDFQVRNLMVHQGTLYVIDFQDARWGPPTYDLASLLTDSVQLDREQMETAIEIYRRELSSRGRGGLPEGVFESSAFMRQFHLMCLQRLLKALGTYGYQIAVRGVPSYRRLLRGTLERTLLALDALPEFAATRGLVESEQGEF